MTEELPLYSESRCISIVNNLFEDENIFYFWIHAPGIGLSQINTGWINDAWKLLLPLDQMHIPAQYDAHIF